MDSRNPKPCPFCGGENIDTKYVWGMPYIICAKCHVQIPCYNNYKEALKAWNTRAESADKINKSKLGRAIDDAIRAYENANIFTPSAIRADIKPLLDMAVDIIKLIE